MTTNEAPRRLRRGASLRATNLSKEIFKRLKHSFSLFHGQGCEKCRQTGYYGRIRIFELFVNNQEVADMISADAPDYKIRQFVRQQGMSSMFDDALSKIKAGITTFAELRRIVPYQIINKPLI